MQLSKSRKKYRQSGLIVWIFSSLGLVATCLHKKPISLPIKVLDELAFLPISKVGKQVVITAYKLDSKAFAQVHSIFLWLVWAEIKCMVPVAQPKQPMYLQLPLRQLEAGNVYLLVLFKAKRQHFRKPHCRNRLEP